MKKIVKWMIGVICFCVSILVFIFIPEYIMRRSDNGYLNKCQSYAQDRSSDVDMDLTLDEKLEIITADDAEQSKIYVIGVSDIEKIKENDKELFSQLAKQINLLKEDQLLPEINIGRNLNQNFSYGSLCAYTIKSKPGKIFYMWELEFQYDTGMGIYNYSFWVDTVTYQIYRADIQDASVQEYLQYIIEYGMDETVWGEKWLLNYKDYLKNSKYGKTEAEDEKGTETDEELAKSLIRNMVASYVDDGTEFFLEGTMVEENVPYMVRCHMSYYYDEYGGQPGFFYFNIMQEQEDVDTLSTNKE